MPKPATGQLRRTDTGWSARIRVSKNKRRSFQLSTCASEAEAKARKTLLASLAHRLRLAGHEEAAPKLLEMAANREGKALQDVVNAVDAMCAGIVEPIEAEPTTPTFHEVAERWTGGELHTAYPDYVKHKKRVCEDVTRFAKYIFPHVGDVHLGDFDRGHADIVMRALPSELAPKTRRHICQLVNRVLELSVEPLRLIDRNPLPRGWIPKVMTKKAKSFLYPKEERALLACSAVPLIHRILYAFLAREGMRKSEALWLEWSDIERGLGVVTLDENKTDDPRAWALGDDVAEALRRWHRHLGEPADDAAVFPLHGELRSDDLRDHLVAAGVTRPQLFEATAKRIPLRVHDLRATFVTLALATGKSEAWVTARTGHQSSQMVANYKRATRLASELNLGWLAPMHEALPQLNGPSLGPEIEAAESPVLGTPRYRWLRGQDLNLRPSGYEPDELPDCSTAQGQSSREPGDVKV